MIKYLPCESKARCMGISREIYVAFVESQGYTYSNDTHPDDSYGFLQQSYINNLGEEITEYVLVVDTDSPYYENLNDILKDRCMSDIDAFNNGWDVPVAEIES